MSLLAHLYKEKFLLSLSYSSYLKEQTFSIPLCSSLNEKCSPLPQAFEHLPPRWQHSLGKFRWCSHNGGNILLGMGFESKGILLHPFWWWWWRICTLSSLQWLTSLFATILLHHDGLLLLGSYNPKSSLS